MNKCKASFIVIFLFFSTPNCASLPFWSLASDSNGPTRFSLNKRDHLRVRIYQLPRYHWPEFSSTKGLLPYYSSKKLLSGLEAMRADRFALLRDRSFALLTNVTGRDHQLRQILELMLDAGIRPKLLLEPEHGLYGNLDEPGPSGIRKENRYSISILSLYSERRKPLPKQLKGIDTIVVDIQNLPVRCYTYISTLTYLMEAAQENEIELMILDRPNPYGIWQAKGSYLQEGYESFVSMAPVPFLYSLTTAEYALYMTDVRFHTLKLSIVKLGGYDRDDEEASLRQAWVNPSPNIPSWESALVYAGVVFFEGTNYSLGRGTTRPFIYSGAPWLDSSRMVEELRARELPGVNIAQIHFIPNASHYAGKHTQGVMISPKSLRFDTLQIGYEYMAAIRRLHPGKLKFSRSKDGRFFIDKLWGGPGYRKAIMSDLNYEDFRVTWSQEAAHFEKAVEYYRLY